MVDENLTEQVAKVLKQAAETHHTVYAITDGADADWATWYSEWLATLSELPELIGEFTRAELTYMLVRLDHEHAEDGGGGPWEPFYAERLVEHFAA